MTDTLIQAIIDGTINRSNISFDHIRNTASRDLGRKSELGWGKNILDTQEQLAQYLYTYGPMIKSQWGNFLSGICVPGGNLRIIDYACGQGLACALIFDNLGRPFSDRVSEVTLIEPSTLALARAKAVVTCYGIPAVVDIPKMLDTLAKEELGPSNSKCTVHLLSNILDISWFDHLALFTKMLETVGRHCILAVSHDRDFDGGSSRFLDIEKFIRTQPSSKANVMKLTIEKFECVNGQPAITMEAHLEVISGSL